MVLLEGRSKVHIEVVDVDKNKQRDVLGVYVMASEMLVADDVAVEHLELVDVMAGPDVGDIVVENDLDLPD